MHVKNPDDVTCPPTLGKVPYSSLLEEDESLEHTLNYVLLSELVLIKEMDFVSLGTRYRRLVKKLF